LAGFLPSASRTRSGSVEWRRSCGEVARRSDRQESGGGGLLIHTGSPVGFGQPRLNHKRGSDDDRGDDGPLEASGEEFRC
jgi:hypothetical protein